MEKIMVYNILEVANTHGGDINYAMELLDEFKSFSGGIKFQPFKYDLIADDDYAWYDTYKKLFFNEEQWGIILAKATETKDVWLDMFDGYSVEILRKYNNLINGIKFQASTLNNYCLLRELSEINLSSKILIVNIAAFDFQEIEEVVGRIERILTPKEIVLQVGFQAYPTDLSDSGLSKIAALRKHFANKLSFADHLAPDLEDATFLPVTATLLGCDIIEKHIKHSTLETNYDAFSSYSVADYEKYLKVQQRYDGAMNQPFINDRERTYLNQSLQVPLISHPLQKGQIPCLESDLDFKRTERKGLNIFEIRKIVKNFHVLVKDKRIGEIFEHEDFKKGVIATIVACRLKSRRLPKKAILKIGDLSSIELCLKNAMKFQNVNHTILATSTEDEDGILKNYTYSDSVIFHRGDPSDVIRRYLDIIEHLKIDVVIRVTGDMPYVSDDILQILLRAHFDNGADYTTAKHAAIGTNLEIINSSSLRKIKKYFPSANYSEYMTFYFKNNPAYFRLNYVTLPSELVRDYRLTLDYPQDLELFRLIDQHFSKCKKGYYIGDLFTYLDSNPEVARINADCTVKYVTDSDLIDELNRETTIRS